MQPWLFFNYFYEAKDFHSPKTYHSWLWAHPWETYPPWTDKAHTEGCFLAVPVMRSPSFLPLALGQCFLVNSYLVFQETGSSVLMAISPQPPHHLPVSCLLVDVAWNLSPHSNSVYKKKTSFPAPRIDPSLYNISGREDKNSPSGHGREHRLETQSLHEPFPPHTMCWGLIVATGLSIQMQGFPTNSWKRETTKEANSSFLDSPETPSPLITKDSWIIF